jgi:hypothetical protein
MIPSASSFSGQHNAQIVKNTVVLNAATVDVPGSIDPNLLVFINLDHSAVLYDQCHGAEPN